MSEIESLASVFRELFEVLGQADYFWEPLTPDRLLACRRSPGAFSALVRYFGLGLEVDRSELERAGLGPGLQEKLEELRPAVSRWGDLFIPHSRWARESGRHEDEYVYLGEESFRLSRRIEANSGLFEGRRALDLGSGSGLLAFQAARVAETVLGLEASAKAVSWAAAAARAQGLSNLSFRGARIGSPEADAAMAGERWDVAVANPPFAVPGAARRPHRDGGALGIEVPLAFLEFAWRHLRPGGEALVHVTNPIIGGRAAFFGKLDSRKWRVIERRRLSDRFNQALSRKEGYAALGIERIELWFLHLRKEG